MPAVWLHGPPQGAVAPTSTRAASPGPETLCGIKTQLLSSPVHTGSWRFCHKTPLSLQLADLANPPHFEVWLQLLFCSSQALPDLPPRVTLLGPWCCLIHVDLSGRTRRFPDPTGVTMNPCVEQFLAEAIPKTGSGGTAAFTIFLMMMAQHTLAESLLALPSALPDSEVSPGTYPGQTLARKELALLL